MTWTTNGFGRIWYKTGLSSSSNLSFSCCLSKVVSLINCSCLETSWSWLTPNSSWSTKRDVRRSLMRLYNNYLWLNTLINAHFVSLSSALVFNNSVSCFCLQNEVLMNYSFVMNRYETIGHIHVLYIHVLQYNIMKDMLRACMWAFEYIMKVCWKHVGIWI